MGDFTGSTCHFVAAITVVLASEIFEERHFVHRRDAAKDTLPFVERLVRQRVNWVFDAGAFGPENEGTAHFTEIPMVLCCVEGGDDLRFNG